EKRRTVGANVEVLKILLPRAGTNRRSTDQHQKGRKGTKSSAAKAPPTKRFGAKAVEEHGLKWFNAQKVANYAPKNWIDEGCLALEYPTIRDTINESGLGYVFAEPEECNLTL
ncbi:hypothetical protein HAX54_041037, partial [Datura stramonium]|nr:hypothetical protein [Datura stramonium]